MRYFFIFYNSPLVDSEDSLSVQVNIGQVEQLNRLITVFFKEIYFKIHNWDIMMFSSIRYSDSKTITCVHNGFLYFILSIMFKTLKCQSKLD